MGTEEDTFNKLRKVSFTQCVEEWFSSPVMPHETEDADTFFRVRGWTMREFYEELNKNG